ncbi:hypothetical protein TrLO_g1945 [Triparma laevis f. longispina]|uniref:TRP C-terminal domain-containing protein n=1 Tax=Triparma laevis f. longispina TaxID=1714387 RepID=A0A9W7AQ85_9STRA|nr:hypothetical protein TrLO_g1945 [Triparma laevis f. longispina]
MNGPACGAHGISLDGNDEYVDIDGWEWDGTTSIEVTDYLVADKSIDCNDPTHKFYQGLSCFFIALYPIGIPVIYFLELWKHREAIQDSDKRETDDEIKHIIFLWRDYRPENWWFEVYECVRRLSLTGGLILIGSGSVTQLVYALLVSVIGLFVITLCKPYNESEENAIAEYTAWAVFLTFLAAIMVTLEFNGLLLSTDSDDDTAFAVLLIVIEAIRGPLFAGVDKGDSVNNGLNIEMGRMAKKVVKKESGDVVDRDGGGGGDQKGDIFVL